MVVKNGVMPEIVPPPPDVMPAPDEAAVVPVVPADDILALPVAVPDVEPACN